MTGASGPREATAAPASPTRTPRPPAPKVEPPAKTPFNSGFAVLEKLRRR